MTTLTLASSLPVVNLPELAADVAAVFAARGITGVDLGHLAALLGAVIPDDVLVDRGHGPTSIWTVGPASAEPPDLRPVPGGAA